MLYNLANDGGFVALKQAAEDRGMEIGDTEKGCQKPAVQQKTTDETVKVRKNKNTHKCFKCHWVNKWL